MGTSNFYKKNASKYFAVLMDYENEDGKTVTTDEWDVDMLKECLMVKVKDVFGSSHDSDGLPLIGKSKNFGDVCAEVWLTVKLNPGYYEGATLDYDIQIMIDGYEYEDIDDVDISHSYMNAGLQAIMLPKIRRWMLTSLDDMREKLEGVFDQCSDHVLVRTATFSNGEAIYEKVS